MSRFTDNINLRLLNATKALSKEFANIEENQIQLKYYKFDNKSEFENNPDFFGKNKIIEFVLSYDVVLVKNVNPDSVFNLQIAENIINTILFPEWKEAYDFGFYYSSKTSFKSSGEKITTYNFCFNAIYSDL